jgi:hypothetical protein
MNVSVVHKSRLTAYVVLGVAFLLLTGVCLLFFDTGRDNHQADEKADQLITELTTAGARAPSKDQIVAVLGDDGGAVCSTSDGALRRGVLYGEITNGAAGPGQRPVIADNRIVQGELLIMKVYCPDQLDDFQKIVQDLKFADVATE